MSLMMLEKADQIVAAVVANRAPLPILTLAEETKLTPKALLKVVKTMAAMKWLKLEDELVHIGPRLVDWGLAAVGTEALLELARPAMARLVEKTRCNATLAVMNMPYITYVCSDGAVREMDLAPRVDSIQESHLCVAGRAVLSHFSDAKLEDYAQTYLSGYTPAELDKLLFAPAKAGRSKGYSECNSEFDPRFLSMGAAILAFTAEPVAALSLWTRNGGPEAKRFAAHGPLLKAEADKLSVAVGYRGEPGQVTAHCRRTAA